MSGGSPRRPLRRGVESIVDGPFGSNLAGEHYVDHGARVIRLGNIGPMRFRDEDKAFIASDHFESLRRHAVAEGDILVAGLGDDRHAVGRACITPKGLGPALVKADCFRLRVRRNIFEDRFVAWFLNSADAEHQIILAARGATRSRATPESILKTNVPALPLIDQRRIADFLDHQVGRIDRITTARERQLQLLIEQSVSDLCGAALGAPGTTVALRRLISSEALGAWGSEAGVDEVDVICARVADFRRESFMLGAAETVRSIDPRSLARREVRAGDILLERSGGSPRNPVGCAVMVEEVSNATICSNFVSRIRSADDVRPDFLAAVLAALYASGQQRPHSTQTTGIQNLDTGSYFSVRVPRPGSDAQKVAADRSWSAIGDANSARLLTAQLSTRLAELKRSLITAAVTGEFDVSTADGSQVKV